MLSSGQDEEMATTTHSNPNCAIWGPHKIRLSNRQFWMKESLMGF